jgi:hypothetical protein
VARISARGRPAVLLLMLLFWLPGGTSQPGIDLPGLLSLSASESVADGSPAADFGTLSPAQLARAAAQHRQLRPADQARLDGLIDSLPGAARGYLLKALAAGHSLTELTGFARAMVGRDGYWLRTHLSPIDPYEPGLAHYRGYLIRQYDGTTCGSTAIVLAHLLTDPLFALQLTGENPGDDTGEKFLARLKAEERRVHGATNFVWPLLLGTPPWGMRDQMDKPAVGAGARYEWAMVPDWAPGAADAVLRRALVAVARGYPVPVLIGDLIPRHYVLLVAATPAGATFFEPGSGAILRIPPADLKRRDFRALGFSTLKGAVLPIGAIRNT